MFRRKRSKNIIKVTPTMLHSNISSNDFVPAIKAIPKWYKEAPSLADPSKEYFDYFGEKVTFTIDGKSQDGETFKHCVPLLDAMTLGYVITTGEDVYFNEDTVSFNKTSTVQQTTHKGYDSEGYVFPDWAYDRMFKWATWLHLELPQGYSAIYMTPMHRYDLPFQTLPGVIDADRHPLEVNTPFVMRKGFTGLIPEGTPIVQIIPFKREDWYREEQPHRVIENTEVVRDFFELDENNRPRAGVYKRKIRKKKNFS